MALIRALNTAVSGLKAQQFRIELIGNNIANVDTVGFKSGRTEFNALLSRFITSGVAPEGNLGGIDPIQLGQGVTVAATTANWNQGSLKLTGVQSDLAVDGDGFFVLKDVNGSPIYTRDGTFSINPANLLHDAATGYIVQGYGIDADFNVRRGGPLSNIEIPVGVMTIARATSSAFLQGNLNSAGAVASDATQRFSDILFDNRYTNGDLISGANPLGLARATADTPLVNLVRSLGDYVPATTSATGTAATAALVFPDLAQQPTGLEITMQASKGSRLLAEDTFIVGDPPPKGGVLLGDLLGFMQRNMGISDGYLDGVRRVEDAYSYARRSPISGEEINGTISLGMNGGADDTVSLTSLTDQQADFRGVKVGDYIRITSGSASGQIAEVVGVTSSVPGGTLDTLQLRSGDFNAWHDVPAYGDTYTIHAPAGVGIAEDTTLAAIAASSGTVTLGDVATSGGVSTFTITDSSVTDFASEDGIAVDQLVTYTSGGVTVQGRVLDVTGNVITVGYRSTLTQGPDADATLTIAEQAQGSIEIAGNVGAENDIGQIEVVAGDSRVSIFDHTALSSGVGESMTTRFTVYDSLGTAHAVDITFVYQSSAANGPNVFRYTAECRDDAGGNPIVGSGTLLFGADGQFLGTGADEETLSIDLDASSAQSGGAATPFTFQLDMSRITQLASSQSEVLLRDQDGFESGTLRQYSVDRDGTVLGVFDNGLIRNLGEIVTARFANPNGLESVGDNLFRAAPNSGIAQTGTPGSGGRGMVRGGYLEESNVDLAEQFTDLIVGQRAFQANARTISTSNELLQELVNLL